MGSKPRSPMQVAPEFERKVKKIQEKIMRKEGKKISLREITEKIARLPTFDEMEKVLMNVNSMDIKINLDRRLL